VAGSEQFTAIEVGEHMWILFERSSESVDEAESLFNADDGVILTDMESVLEIIQSQFTETRGIDSSLHGCI
jgi:hypothetical protein